MSGDEHPFPRGTNPPVQSTLFWVNEKDRYLRQLLIRDIEEETKRSLVVCYMDCDSHAQIDTSDDKYLLELLDDVGGDNVDLLLETNGGLTDATEKVVSILRNEVRDLRVIVPKRAKSNGTLLALAAREIVLGPASELGPIDPLLVTKDGAIPCQFIVDAKPPLDPVITQFAEYAIKQTKKLAVDLLKSGMMREACDKRIHEVVNRLSTRDVYHSHGSVIDYTEAENLGLKVNRLGVEDRWWKFYWLLRCMYEHDARLRGVEKIFEGRKISSSISASVA